MATSRRDVEFKTFDGLVLRAWMYPANAKGPCIIMSHGFGGLKRHYLENFAKRFQAEGWSAIAYDNRNWGDSDGLPRNEIDPALQVRDYYDAFDFAANQPEVDPTRIVYWGSSLSGGNVICAAAIDKRIRAVIAQIPFVSGELQTAPLAPLIPGLFANRSDVRAGNPSANVPIIPESLEDARSGRSRAILNSLEAFQFLTETQKLGGDWKNEVTLQSLFNLLSHEPRAFIHRVAPTPLLMVVVDNDETVRTTHQLAAYQQALEPKQLYVVRNFGHFGVYDGLGFEENVNVQVNFLRKNL